MKRIHPLECAFPLQRHQQRARVLPDEVSQTCDIGGTSCICNVAVLFLQLSAGVDIPCVPVLIVRCIPPRLHLIALVAQLVDSKRVASSFLTQHLLDYPPSLTLQDRFLHSLNKKKSPKKMVHLDGHELAVVTTTAGAIALVHRTLPRTWVRGLIHRQPVVAMSCAWALIGVTLPLVVPPLRRMMKLPTNQYEADHPNVVLPRYY